MNNQVALITGAGGFIGSHLTEELVEKGYTVRALVQYNAQGSIGWLSEVSKEVLANVEIIFGDIRDPHFCQTLVEGVHQVYHLAALISIPHSYTSPASYIDTNVNGTLNLLEAIRKFSQIIESITITSSSEVYGNAIYFPMDEEHPTQAKSPYAASKIAQEQLALSYYHTYSLPVKIARPFNTFGPRQSVRAVISVIAKQALMQKGNFNLGNLSPERDWVYVKDTVKGLRLIAEKGTVGEVYNIATEQSRSVQEVVELACSIMNIEPEISADATKVRPGTGEVYKLLGAKEKIGKLGWHPDYSFQEGLTLLIDWLQKKELEIYKAKNILYQ